MGKSGWLGSKRASDASEVKGRETRKLTKDRGWSVKVGGGRTTARTTDEAHGRHGRTRANERERDVEVDPALPKAKWPRKWEEGRLRALPNEDGMVALARELGRWR